MEQPQRRLSFARVLLVLVILVAIIYALLMNLKTQQEVKSVANFEPWFASYVDVTATPSFDFEQLGSTPTSQVVLSFIVSSGDEPCMPTWGNYYSLDEAAVSLDLDRRIARLQQLGGRVAISFGGALNNELSSNCTDHAKLVEAYESVIERYNIDTIDLDLEGVNLSNQDAAIRRSKAIFELQKKRREDGKSLAVWLTLPVAPQGMTPDGTNAVAQALASGVDLSGVNLMVMDYGESKNKSDTMFEASKKALIEGHRQLSILYSQAEINLNSSTIWRKIGATPMIGQNDVKDEVFTIEDAKNLNKFATTVGIGRLSMWSANRDLPCGENYVNIKLVSDACSGVSDKKQAYSLELSNGFKGNFSQNSMLITTEDSDTKVHEIDDPNKSPYQVWEESATYLEGVKVVWHGNVYESKWWTRGDLPDNPVLQSWETPWQLIGPVLDGEQPVEQLKLPKGTYPDWSGSEEYDAGELILFNDVPYRAKWWNQGESPGQSSSNTDASPWIALSQKQIEEILAKK